MFNIIKTRIQQKYRTFDYPDGAPPELPPRFVGRPVVSDAQCSGEECGRCISICPVQAIILSNETNGPVIDTGKCIFCRQCEDACGDGVIQFSRNYQLAASERANLIVKAGAPDHCDAGNKVAEKLFKRSLKLRQVSAGGWNAARQTQMYWAHLHGI
jgi:formate hydrogenlyase subunit 6/NADH:ubiquinone oxidoreductase subunit I